MMLKHNEHTPAHLLLDDTVYFITGAIYLKRHLLTEPSVKQKLLELMQKHFQKYQWTLHQWVILDNHYHLIAQSQKGSDLPKIIRNIHSASAWGILHQTPSCEKPIWWNYWDYCPRNEKDCMIRMNYLLYNPVKHGYTTNLQEYPFSSFHTSYTEMGRESLVEQFRAYPEYKTLILREAHKDDF